MLIQPDLGLIFIHVPKSGGSSVKAMLRALPGFQALPEGLWTHSSAADARRVLGAETFDRCWRFAVVRHPAPRLLSWAAFRLDRAEDRQRRRAASLPVKAGTTAERDAAVIAEMKGRDPVDWIVNTPHSVDKFGFEPKRQDQTAWFEDAEGRRLVDAVYRLEDAAVWGPALAARVGLKGCLPHANRSSATAGPIDRRLAAFVRRHHQRTLTAFDYRL
ncbi:hypothetical protein ASG17_13950 [Brevundimonas sp. Leaf363]|uniref:sulfotransferase family 2 domain-containing protein n=1 Tax=Brevundimonas sp. Leaf363 TaxID=1736353 RepID=UPI0006FB2EFA|nr:sulfotransferase family 2 domain-containing protein [Brevundimonas sp. Leaf363]KQS54043.1 hypothetical protein ASG17_13950 [Brevundimonas sp. Leaf363]